MSLFNVLLLYIGFSEVLLLYIQPFDTAHRDGSFGHTNISIASLGAKFEPKHNQTMSKFWWKWWKIRFSKFVLNHLGIILGYCRDVQDTKKHQKTYSRTSIDGRVFWVKGKKRRRKICHFLKVHWKTYFWLCISIVLSLYIEVPFTYIKKEGACKVSARTARWMQQTHCYTFWGVKFQKMMKK